MKTAEALVLVLAILVFGLFFTYFGSEFITKYVGLPLILVFILAIFFPPVWGLLLIYSIFKRLEDGKSRSRYQAEPYYHS
jgi:hypothetical protein